MATLSVLTPVSEEAENRKKDARNHWKAIQEAGPLVSRNSLRVGFHASALKRDSMWEILGFENEKEAMLASGVKDSTWYNVIRIAESYTGVEEHLFIAMKLSNAEALMDLPESKRLTEYWMRMASTESVELFQGMVDDELDGKEKASNGRERIVPYSVKMPKSRAQAVKTGMLEIARELGCEGDESRALELIVAEHRDSTSLVGSISKAIERIGKIRELQNSGLSAAEVLEKVNAELEEMASVFRSALEALQNLESRQQ